MKLGRYNALVVLGPTASGKTRLGARLAREHGGEVLSADSRQVYRGLNIGSGKDLDEYVVEGVAVPYHLIDIVDLNEEFNLFDFQQRFYTAFEDVTARGALPMVVGGTGLYLEAALKNYRMVAVPENPGLRSELAGLSQEALEARLLNVRGTLHNTTDTADRDRLVRAIEIAQYSREHEPPPAPHIDPLILGTLWDRTVLRERIRIRLRERLEHGMIDEVNALHTSGISWARLEQLGLEYRFIAQYLQGAIAGKNDLFQKLQAAICQFAKRQDTWFRRMERNGATIHWIPGANHEEARHTIGNILNHKRR